jgi:hypothetical protein
LPANPKTKGEIEMKTYLKILALLIVITVASFKILASAVQETPIQTAIGKTGLYAGPDLRQPEKSEAYIPGNANLSTYGWFDRSIDMCR